MRVPDFIAAGGLCALLAIAAGPSLACPSGLVVIPTADLIGAGQYGVELQSDGDASSLHGDTTIINTEIGLSDRFEAGVDCDVSHGGDHALLLNAKYALIRGDDGARALAVGIGNLGNGYEGIPYLVGTRDFKCARGHAGIVRTDGKGRPFAGADRAITDRLVAMVDYTHGRENGCSGGFSYQMSDRVGLTVGAIFPNGDGPTRYTAHLVLTGAIR